MSSSESTKSSMPGTLLVLIIVFAIALTVYGAGAMYVYIMISQGKKPGGESWLGPVMATFFMLIWIFALALIVVAVINFNTWKKIKTVYKVAGCKAKVLSKHLTSGLEKAWEAKPEDEKYETREIIVGKRRSGSPVRKVALDESAATGYTVQDQVNEVIEAVRCPDSAREALDRLDSLGLIKVQK